MSVCLCPFETLFLLLQRQIRLPTVYIGLQSTIPKSFPDCFSSYIGEAEPLEVGNIMCFSACQHSGSNTNIMGGKFAGVTRFGFHMIEILDLSVPVVDVVDSGSMNFENFSDLLI
jgi:hypothetical protein